MYHSISEEKGNDAVISPALFAEQMAYLHSQGYNPVTLDQLYDYLTGQKGLPPKPVAITFDDGYRDTYEIALPILKRYGFKSTLFVLTADSERRLTWQELREMKAAGMEIASHSYTHRNLAGMTATAQADEITRSKELLDRNLNQDTRFFCYPTAASARRR
ncbi:polysaccharide deacetylase family protein [Anaeroselena agilis]|uniref:Polysaccharide deacetylase family protein n=1 Tax=Anaeroselena agilis TaxID=3063788 RepID=A0ABU3NTF4_9FIRM|nr:polysaccharide deacetylase family protein [Selenomonadales bacterium 4137-cl]